ncbi:Alpha/Beta hydrolase protein [Kickxella alabastrina]|uniref:Alpha/Beta hydrolase protein n=1 Tax=Kickxella alabastrina TaxID=61397 RepID=UPI00221FDAC1|nr:Alpha/Beta hydrolase protein [Kickxella alabastrina]KAI7820897.1 Alpha/Beta hydrolase protein [Kickxella alabastrina]
MSFFVSQFQIAEAPISVFILCHGLLDTKHAPLFQHLQKTLPFATVSFDFRGNGHSTGTTSYGNYHEEANDIKQVIEYVNSEQMRIHTGKCHFVGWSVFWAIPRGIQCVFVCPYVPTLCPQMIVGVSPRFWLARETPNRWKPHQVGDLQTKGMFLWRTYGNASNQTQDDTMHGSELNGGNVPRREYWVKSEHLDQRCSTRMDIVKDLPFEKCAVLNISGACDKVVPEEDLWEYDRLMRMGALDTRKVTTRVVPGASHFWNNKDELFAIEEVISSWLDSGGSALCGGRGSYPDLL